MCGGSKLRSITSVEDLTLRKGEFWSCSQCTLKNSLATHTCSACKAPRQSSAHVSRQPNNTAASPNVMIAPTTTTTSTGGGSVTATNMKNSSSQASISGSNSSSSGNNKHTNIVGSGSNHNNLMPPVNRVSRSPSRNDRLSSGAIPKVSLCILHSAMSSRRFLRNSFSNLFPVLKYF